jgi:hypothetical protein
MLNPYSAARHTTHRGGVPSLASALVQVNWLESMMATTGDSENVRRCNTLEFTLFGGVAMENGRSRLRVAVRTLVKTRKRALRLRRRTPQ